MAQDRVCRRCRQICEPASDRQPSGRRGRPGCDSLLGQTVRAGYERRLREVRRDTLAFCARIRPTRSHVVTIPTRWARTLRRGPGSVQAHGPNRQREARMRVPRWHQRTAIETTPTHSKDRRQDARAAVQAFEQGQGRMAQSATGWTLSRRTKSSAGGGKLLGATGRRQGRRRRTRATDLDTVAMRAGWDLALRMGRVWR